MPFLVAGTMLLAHSWWVRSDFVVSGQIRIFRLEGTQADRRRTMLRRLSAISFVSGVIALLFGTVVLVA